MTSKIFYLSILILTFLSCKKDSQTGSTNLEKSKTDMIDSLGNRYVELNRFSGVVLATQDDTIIYNNSFGLADYENRKPFTNKSAFKIGEVSELITANLIRELAKKNKLQLSDKISKHIPEIKIDLTINNLLNHKTNLPTIKLIQEQNPELKYSAVAYANLANTSSDTAAKSDLDYSILGLLIEKISRKSLQENIKNYSKDLDLENTYFQKADSSLAVGYLYHNYQGTGLELQKSPVSNSEITFSSNGLKSTASDLEKIIRSNYANELEIDGYLENDGFSYSIINNPKTKIIIIVLSNRRHPVAKEISNSVTAILEDNEYKLPLARKPFDLDKSLLKDYSGYYTLNENMDLEVLNKNDSLFFMMGSNKIHLIPQSNNQFYTEQMDASMRFLRDLNDEVNEVELLDGFLEGNRIKRSKKTINGNKNN